MPPARRGAQIPDPTPELQQVAPETFDLKIWRSDSHSQSGWEAADLRASASGPGNR